MGKGFWGRQSWENGRSDKLIAKERPIWPWGHREGKIFYSEPAKRSTNTGRERDKGASKMATSASAVTKER